MKDESQYSNREIDRMFGEIKEYLVRNETTNKEILTQVKATNGRVNALEKWKEGLMGKVWGVGTTAGFVWGIILIAINKYF
jgi:hypothetical protein